MKLYGTTTSPFVRRVRVVAAELGVPVTLVSTATDTGQAELKQLSPIAKVPIAEVADGPGTRVLFDSRVIIDWMGEHHGRGPLVTATDRWHEANLINTIDAAVDSAIQLFYLRRDGVAVDGSPFAARQLARIEAICGHLTAALDGPGFAGDALDLATVSLVAGLDWMRFRDAYPVARHPALIACLDHWNQRPSFAASRPVAS